ncbi:MAG: hypothetical protein QN178_04070 [Armatimonadota bacterium]|nr:hypothetical protein [Armatimonadota bacterium]
MTARRKHGRRVGEDLHHEETGAAVHDSDPYQIKSGREDVSAVRGARHQPRVRSMYVGRVGQVLADHPGADAPIPNALRRHPAVARAMGEDAIREQLPAMGARHGAEPGVWDQRSEPARPPLLIDETEQARFEVGSGLS